MRENILTMRERQRVAALKKAQRREVTVRGVAELVGLSERQVYRLKVRFRKWGEQGLAHGNRGRPCRRKLGDKMRERVIRLRKEKYVGFNDHHFTEKLSEVEGISVSRETVRQWLRQAEVEAVRKRRGSRHRCRREPMPRMGMMLQADGSYHDWLEGRGDYLTLIGTIDDATNWVPEDCFFAPHETTLGYMRLFYFLFKKKGLPLSIYADRHSIFWTERNPTEEEQLLNKRPKTQLGRALEELGIRLIPAYSSQAKGRVERLWETFQDRLVSEMRLKGDKNEVEANATLQEFIPPYNRRFSRKPANPESAWRPIPEETDLRQILCIKEKRTVANDNTIAWKGRRLQISPSRLRRSFAKRQVEVRHLINNKIEVYYKNQRIARFHTQSAHENAPQSTITHWEDLRYTQKITERQAA